MSDSEVWANVSFLRNFVHVMTPQDLETFEKLCTAVLKEVPISPSTEKGLQDMAYRFLKGSSLNV